MPGAGIRRIAASKRVPIPVDLPRKAQTGASEAPGPPAEANGPYGMRRTPWSPIRRQTHTPFQSSRARWKLVRRDDSCRQCLEFWLVGHLRGRFRVGFSGAAWAGDEVEPEVAVAFGPVCGCGRSASGIPARLGFVSVFIEDAAALCIPLATGNDLPPDEGLSDFPVPTPIAVKVSM